MRPHDLMMPFHAAAQRCSRPPSGPTGCHPGCKHCDNCPLLIGNLHSTASAAKERDEELQGADRPGTSTHRCGYEEVKPSPNTFRGRTRKGVVLLVEAQPASDLI